MSLGIVTPLLAPLIDLARSAIGDPERRAELEAALTRAAAASERALDEARRDVVVAEATGHSPAQRNWRPHFMYVCMALLVWYAVPLPLLSVLLDTDLADLIGLSHVPPGLWTLLTVGMGGYIGARTVEKLSAGR